ncbi:hypothetical protein GCM10027275_22350 [Rhabdobacter roseus]|uniref:Lipocalin-like domain-containing protein n=1 Tax=Rhabdobacter roseus TaxID=1655419 RepID=A0A840TW41_9BACT|nr:hypothetical protein [Rhabdobacter roseus]MBB5284170.1 hypothetical protein [Rhabdobacter roseus]
MKKMNVVRSWAVALLAVVGLVACTADNLVGTWEVTAYEMNHPGQQGVRVEHIGTITFHKDQNGEKEIQYSVLERTFADSASFTWTKQEGYVTLLGPDSEFTKTWIVVEDKRNSQIWRSTDGSNTVQLLELKKK